MSTPGELRAAAERHYHCLSSERDVDVLIDAARRLADPVTLGKLAWDAVHAHGAFSRDFPDETYYRAVGEAIARGETNEEVRRG